MFLTWHDAKTKAIAAVESGDDAAASAEFSKMREVEDRAAEGEGSVIDRLRIAVAAAEQDEYDGTALGILRRILVDLAGP